jgi:hypothetical protein
MLGSKMILGSLTILGSKTMLGSKTILPMSQGQVQGPLAVRIPGTGRWLVQEFGGTLKLCIASGTHDEYQHLRKDTTCTYVSLGQSSGKWLLHIRHIKKQAIFLPSCLGPPKCVNAAGRSYRSLSPHSSNFSE